MILTALHVPLIGVGTLVAVILCDIHCLPRPNTLFLNADSAPLQIIALTLIIAHFPIGVTEFAPLSISEAATLIRIACGSIMLTRAFLWATRWLPNAVAHVTD